MVKDRNPNMQIIAVGDLEQKIYDKTTLNVEKFMREFLEEHLRLKFTQCFRLSHDLASMLGRVWKKQIIGVNNSCKVEEMSKEDVIPFLSEQLPADILCLGARTGMLSDTLNILEERYPNKFNKNTVYATISDNDSMGKTVPREGWSVGKDITERHADSKWGNKFFQNRSMDMTDIIPNAKGFSPTNLRYMMRFYALFKDIEIVPQLEEQFGMATNKVFMIPWGHVKLLVDKCHDNLQKFNFYVDKIIENN